MIKIGIGGDGRVELGQYSPTPTVYLDHWALRTISEQPVLADRFLSGLETRGGTLALSWINLLEFAKVRSEEQVRWAESLIDRTLPRLFFIEVNPWVVIQRENELLAGGPPIPPHGDVEFLRPLLNLKPEIVTPLSAHEILSAMSEEELVRLKEGMEATFVRQVKRLRSELATDPSLQAAARSPPHGPQLQHGTRYILRELVRSLAADQKKRITEQDAADFFHTVVPVAYCDFVLLDRHWSAQVEQIRARFRAAALSVPVAKVLSKGQKGLELLVDALEQPALLV